MKPSVKVARQIVVTIKALDERHGPFEKFCQRVCFGVESDIFIVGYEHWSLKLLVWDVTPREGRQDGEAEIRD
jgi:hypothetical protein